MITPRVFYAPAYSLPPPSRPRWRVVLAPFCRRRCGATAQSPRTLSGWRQPVWQTRLRWLGVILALAAGGFGLHAASQQLLDPVRFPLRHVRLDGELRNLSQEELQQIVQGYLGQNIFTVDIAAVQSTLAAHPWIEQVSVRRQWPDLIEVEFRERTAFGYWGENEMVDVNGARFHPAVVRQPGPWPRLSGPPGREPALIHAYQTTDAMLSGAGLRLVELTQDERRAWRLLLDNGLEIRLGREQFFQQLQRFVDIYPQVLAGYAERIAVVDLRYTHGFAVRWTSPGTNQNGVMATRATAGEAARAKPAKAG